MKRWVPVLLVVTLTTGACSTRSVVGDHPGGSAGIEGTVLFGPLCPVEQANSPCPDRPIVAEITVSTETGATAGKGTSDESGRYRIFLPPGSYSVTARAPGSGAFGASKPVDVVVMLGRLTHLDLMVDSGIR
jgi:hypothetical protein